MKIILTGITGNLGSEIFHSLKLRGHEIVPVIRADCKDEAFRRLKSILGKEVVFSEIIISDLQGQLSVTYPLFSDCIIHCAGVVQFKDVSKQNEEMARNITRLACQLKIPLYHISTAFVWKADNAEPLNEYEKDKIRAEKVIVDSKIPGAIFRPSILTGNSITGKIINFTGYHMVLKSFIKAVGETSNNLIRFPLFTGETNILPVDLAADTIVNFIENEVRGTFFISNPTPPASEWLILESVKILSLDNKILFIDCSLDKYEQLDLSQPERKLFNFLKHFIPYWTGSHIFPDSQVKSVVIDKYYLKKIIDYARLENWI